MGFTNGMIWLYSIQHDHGFRAFLSLRNGCETIRGPILVVSVIEKCWAIPHLELTKNVGLPVSILGHHSHWGSQRVVIITQRSVADTASAEVLLWGPPILLEPWSQKYLLGGTETALSGGNS